MALSDFELDVNAGQATHRFRIGDHSEVIHLKQVVSRIQAIVSGKGFKVVCSQLACYVIALLQSLVQFLNKETLAVKSLLVVIILESQKAKLFLLPDILRLRDDFLGLGFSDVLEAVTGSVYSSLYSRAVLVVEFAILVPVVINVLLRP